LVTIIFFDLLQKAAYFASKTYLPLKMVMQGDIQLFVKEIEAGYQPEKNYIFRSYANAVKTGKLLYERA
jgi:hypothetical protein